MIWRVLFCNGFNFTFTIRQCSLVRLSPCLLPDFLYFTKLAQACFQIKNFTRKKMCKYPLKYKPPVHFSNLNCPLTLFQTFLTNYHNFPQTSPKVCRKMTLNKTAYSIYWFLTVSLYYQKRMC